MKRILINLGTGLLALIYHICHTKVPPKRIVCISRQKNTAPEDFRLIADSVRKNHPDYEVVILAKQLQNPLKYAFHMVKQVFYIARSSCVVLDSYCIAVSLLNRRITAPVLQIWHALGDMKKFGYTALDTPGGHSSHTAAIMHMHEGYDSVLVSSKSFAKDLAAGFNVDPGILTEIPLPRVDLLVDPDYKKSQREKILKAFPALRDKKNIVYCPTFRRVPSSNEAQAMKNLLDAVDFKHYNLIFKKHPVSTQRFNDSRVLEDYPQSYNMLYVADYVISDYSTIIYEVGLLKLPVYLYAYDWADYSEKSQLYLDLEHDVPTLFTGDAKEIMRAIEHDDFDYSAYETFIEKNIALPKDKSCADAVVDHIFKLIADSKKS
ncbi:MAG: CDP-glycerol glycerophosphotransferase family protein [Eggerthellaceae bacterium]|jgi:CDP-ribitol ribitolphosphotransferase